MHCMHMPPCLLLCTLTCAYELSAASRMGSPHLSHPACDQTLAGKRHCTTLLKSLRPFLVLQLPSLRDENKTLCAARGWSPYLHASAPRIEKSISISDWNKSPPPTHGQNFTEPLRAVPVAFGLPRANRAVLRRTTRAPGLVPLSQR